MNATPICSEMQSLFTCPSDLMTYPLIAYTVYYGAYKPLSPTGPSPLTPCLRGSWEGSGLVWHGTGRAYGDGGSRWTRDVENGSNCQMYVERVTCLARTHTGYCRIGEGGGGGGGGEGISTRFRGQTNQQGVECKGKEKRRGTEGEEIPRGPTFSAICTTSSSGM